MVGMANKVLAVFLVNEGGPQLIAAVVHMDQVEIEADLGLQTGIAADQVKIPMVLVDTMHGTGAIQCNCL